MHGQDEDDGGQYVKKKKKKGLLGSDQHPGKRRESKRARLGRH